MISQTQTSANQYGFYAVPKKLQPKKKYRQTYDEEDYNDDEQQIVQNNFIHIQKQPVPENQIERDFYVDQAPYPQFKPKERGLDYGVQIQRGDLFDFDIQVQPLLQILVGRSVVSAINQLQQDKEKKQKKQKMDTYLKKRNAQLMVTQRLEAKNKRKKEESQRRVLQKEVYVKNTKETGKKLICRKAAKNSLLGLKNQIFNQLQEDGYLRSDPYTDLRVGYEGWLYEQITQIIHQQKLVRMSVESIVRQTQKDNQNQHLSNIKKQKERRKAIQDQRQRIKRQNQQKKQKKRVRKQKRQLNSQRQPNSIKFEQLLQKYNQLQSILKFETRSNGYIRNNNTNSNTAYISGGLFNFFLALINSVDQITAEQAQKYLHSLLGQSVSPISIYLKPQHNELIQEYINTLNQNTGDFMKNKKQKVSQLKQKISLNLRMLELANINLKSSTHESVLQAILNISLNSINIQKKQGQDETYQLTELDKKREQLKKMIQFKTEEQINLQNLEQILRVHFERIDQSQKNSQQPKSEVNSQHQWIQVYDGEGWSKRVLQNPKQCQRENQKPAAYSLSGFDNTFVFDQRNLHYLQRQMQTLLGIEAGSDLKRYIQSLSHLQGKIDKALAVYDGQIRYQ